MPVVIASVLAYNILITKHYSFYKKVRYTKMTKEFTEKFHKINSIIADGRKVSLWEHNTKGEDYPAQLVVDNEVVFSTWDDIYTAYDEWKTEQEENEIALKQLRWR